MSAETVEIDDGELIRRSAHDPEQFPALFDRYAQQIHLYVARRLGTQAADDIVAETFLAAFRRRGTYDTSFALARPWLYGIATTLIARHRRQEERLLRALSRTGVDPLPEALASLPRGHRDVLLLVAWEDMSYEEVARALDISVGTVRSRLHRARKKARNVLGDEEL